METYYIIYKITNKINGKLYIGMHKTKNLDDGYMGSGKYLRRAIEKHGVDNFDKEILHILDTEEEMRAKEAEIVTEEFISEENTYNLRVGGRGGGGWTSEQQIKNNRRSQKKQRWLRENDEDWALRNKIRGIEANKIMRSSPNWYRSDQFSFKGQKHTEETKRSISAKAKERLQDPTKNSQYGTRWIHSLEEKRSMKIGKNDPIPSGWLPGRKIKNFDIPTCRGCGKEFTRNRYEEYCSKNCKSIHAQWDLRVGKTSPSWKGYWKTPLGVFITLEEAATAIGTTKETIRRRAKNPNFPEYERISNKGLLV